MDYRILYSLPFFVAAVFILVIAILCFNRFHVKGGAYLFFVCLAATLWAGSEGALYFGFDEAENLFITRIQYFGIASVPPLSLLFVLSVFGYDPRLIKVLRLPLLLLSAVIVLLVWTNPFHGLIFSGHYTIDTGPFPMLGLEHGPLWWMVLAYNYLLVLGLSLLLMHQVYVSKGYYRSQAKIILAAVSLVWLCNAVYISGNSPIPNMDISSIAFVLVAAAMAWALFRYKLLDILPLAKSQIFEGLEDVVVVLDHQDRLIDLNPAAEALLNTAASRVIGKFVGDLADQWPQLSRALNAGDSSDVVFIKDGDSCEYNAHISPLKSQDGSGLGKVLFLRDITRQRRLEAQLRQAQKMESVGRLAGGVAHDFNNMLSVVLGRTEVALMDMDAQEKPGKYQRDFLEIQKAAKCSADLTRQLLAFARKQTISPRTLDLNESVEGMLKMLRRLIGEDIQLNWRPGKSLWPVRMDPSQLDQILANLCVNARDAIQGAGNFTLETDTAVLDGAYCRRHPGFVPGEFVLLSVSDDGIGMDKDTRENAFEPFFTTKGSNEGTGLGLSMIYGIVKQNHGFVNVYSEPDMGTTFKIYLPRQKRPVDEIHASASSGIIKGGDEAILLVEDDEAILDVVKEMLGNLGYSVHSAVGPLEAIEAVRKMDEKPVLLMTDVVMPEMNGRALSEKLKSMCPDLKSLFMSGYTDDVIARHGVLEKGCHFIQKPFSMEGLSLKVREVLDA